MHMAAQIVQPDQHALVIAFIFDKTGPVNPFSGHIERRPQGRIRPGFDAVGATYANRLPRGRTYARKGTVTGLSIQAGL